MKQQENARRSRSGQDAVAGFKGEIDLPFTDQKYTLATH